MKPTQWLSMFSLLVLLAACGKENKTGKTPVVDTYDYSNPYNSGLNPLTSPYSYNGISVDQVIAENPCISGYGGYPAANTAGAYSGQRIRIEVPLTNFATVIAPNDVYVGVTSYGDVAAMVGTSPGQPPLFVGYMCPRSFSPNGQGQLMGIKPGVSTNCLLKPIVAATVVFPGGATADFRMLDYGSSARQKFSFCR